MGCHLCSFLFFVLFHPGLYLATRIRDVHKQVRGRGQKKSTDDDDTLTFTRLDQTGFIFCYTVILTALVVGTILLCILRKLGATWQYQWIPQCLFFGVFLFLPVTYYLIRKRHDKDFWTTDREPKLSFAVRDIAKWATIIIEFFQLSSFSFGPSLGWGKPGVSSVFGDIGAVVNLELRIVGNWFTQAGLLAILIVLTSEVLLYSASRYAHGGDLPLWRSINDFVLDSGFLTITSSISSILFANYLSDDPASKVVAIVCMVMLVSYFSCCFGVLSGRADQHTDMTLRHKSKDHSIIYMPGFQIMEKVLKALLVTVVVLFTPSSTLYLFCLLPINVALVFLMFFLVPASHFEVNLIRGGLLTVCLLSTCGALLTQAYLGNAEACDTIWYVFLGSCLLLGVIMILAEVNHRKGAPYFSNWRINKLFSPEYLTETDLTVVRPDASPPYTADAAASDSLVRHPRAAPSLTPGGAGHHTDPAHRAPQPHPKGASSSSRPAAGHAVAPQPHPSSQQQKQHSDYL